MADHDRLRPFALVLLVAACALASGCGAGGGVSCEDFEAQPDPGGELCEEPSDCAPVDCPCADGSVIQTQYCANGACEGKAACEDACRGAGGQLDCSGGGSNGNGSCDPATCDSLGAECGEPADGCGGTLACGGCSGTETCDSGQCVADECEPETCESLNAECGEPADGCGGTLSCGTCDGGSNCSAGTCVVPEPTGATCPSSCQQPGFYPAVYECGGCEGGYCYFESPSDTACTRECTDGGPCSEIGDGWSCSDGVGYCVP